MLNHLKKYKAKLHNVGITLMGSQAHRGYSGEQSKWGWGKFIDDSGLKILKCICLPSSWTLDEKKKHHICLRFLSAEYYNITTL